MLFAEQELAAIEALLFVAKEPLSISKLAEILEITEENVQELLGSLQERYANKASGLTLVEIDHCYRLGTKPEMAAYIETLYKQPSQVLSSAALEVLSIVAYRQPITRGEIEFIRGVQSDRSLATLVEKDLVQEVGRKDGPGRPILYGTTEQFLLHFGLKSLDDLPKIKLTAEEAENGVGTEVSAGSDANAGSESSAGSEAGASSESKAGSEGKEKNYLLEYRDQEKQQPAED